MISLIVHGGAWNIPQELVASHREGLARALNVGWEILLARGSAVDAVERTINALEDDPTFDAGKGSFLNALGEIELDASIMNGSVVRAGAVAAVPNIRYPISLARKVMDESEHLLLSGMGAVRFAKEKGIEQCQPDDLLVDREIARWRRIQGQSTFSTKEVFKKDEKLGTVGAVAIDDQRTIVAGTSTGGTPNKYPGRVGDSALIGCGTYADSGAGGVSCTGWGEGIIKVVLAKTTIDLMEQNGWPPQAAADWGIRLLARKTEGLGGMIVLDKEGKVGWAFNTPRMARAHRTSEMSEPVVEV
ncbi:MAG: isoaspartyl peptidase/L-asparaginase [Bacteroidota bacterium]